MNIQIHRVTVSVDNSCSVSIQNCDHPKENVGKVCPVCGGENTHEVQVVVDERVDMNCRDCGFAWYWLRDIMEFVDHGKKKS